MLHITVHSHQLQDVGKSLGAGEGWHEWMGYIVQWQQTLAQLLPKPLNQAELFDATCSTSPILFR